MVDKHVDGWLVRHHHQYQYLLSHCLVVDEQTDLAVNAGTLAFSDVLRACGNALQGYILSTYSLDLRRLAKEFAPFIKVPSLILHGDDGCKRVPKTNTFYHATLSSSSTESEPKIVTDWKIEMPKCMEVVHVDCRTKHSGVHHSKFLLCFCKNHFRLAISTENMTASRCSNAIWLSPKLPTVPKPALQTGRYRCKNVTWDLTDGQSHDTLEIFVAQMHVLDLICTVNDIKISFALTTYTIT